MTATLMMEMVMILGRIGQFLKRVIIVFTSFGGANAGMGILPDDQKQTM
jgi:hypothetical protein